MTTDKSVSYTCLCEDVRPDGEPPRTGAGLAGNQRDQKAMSETPTWKPQQPLTLSLCLVLIHNNNEARTPVIKSNINSMCRILRAVCDVGSFELASQPDVTPLSDDIELSRKKQLHDLCCEWEVYKGKVPPVLEQPLSVTPADRRSGAIEMMLSDKHIRAWDLLLDSEFDLAICFEDDAIFQDTSCQRLLDVLKVVQTFDKRTNLFADLAGGCPLATLGVEKLFDRAENGLVYYKKPVTNTSCTYLLNRAMAKEFKTMVLYNPSLRYITPDWMINRIFIEIEKDGKRSICFHADPTVFVHGSASGFYSSTLGSRGR